MNMIYPPPTSRPPAFAPSEDDQLVKPITRYSEQLEDNSLIDQRPAYTSPNRPNFFKRQTTRFYNKVVDTESKEWSLCCCCVSVVALIIFLGVFFGVSYPQLVEEQDRTSTTCYPKDVRVEEKRCCEKVSCSCSSSNSAQSCYIFISRLEEGVCSDGECCRSRCCIAHCQKCSEHCTGTGSNRHCSQRCTSYCCNEICCTTGTDMCSSVCGTCTNIYLDFTRSDSFGDKMRSMTVNCGRDDVSCVDYYRELFSSSFKCWYNKSDPDNTTLTGKVVNKDVYWAWGIFATISVITCVVATVFRCIYVRSL